MQWRSLFQKLPPPSFPPAVPEVYKERGKETIGGDGEQKSGCRQGARVLEGPGIPKGEPHSRQ